MKSFKTVTLLFSCIGLMAMSNAFAQNKMVGGAPMYPSKDIVSNAVNSKDHTTLVAAVKAQDWWKPCKARARSPYLHLPTVLLKNCPREP